MSSIRKFRDLASIAIKAALGDTFPEKVKHLDALLTGIAELLDGEDMGRTHQLSTVAEMAFGNPSMMMGPAFDREIPYPFGALRRRGGPAEESSDPFANRSTAVPGYRFYGGGVPTHIPDVDVRSGKEGEPPSSSCSSSSREPRLIIHESPTVKVTKVGGDQGTTLESLFLGLDPLRRSGPEEDPDARRFAMDGESMAGVDHESIRSEDVGVCCDDDEEDDDTYPLRSSLDEKEEEPIQELDDKIFVEYEGRPYFRGIVNNKAYDAKEDGTPGACIGVWAHDRLVPFVK